MHDSFDIAWRDPSTDRSWLIFEDASTVSVIPLSDSDKASHVDARRGPDDRRIHTTETDWKTRTRHGSRKYE